MDAPTNSTTLEHRLSELFGNPVRVTAIRRQEGDTERLVVCDFEYSSRPRLTSSATVVAYRQTGVVFISPNVVFPHFMLTPEDSLAFRIVRTVFGEMGDIDFADSPEFSSRYHLFGWSQKAVRELFTEPVRNRLAEHPGWCLRAKGDCIVLYRHHTVIPEDELPEFVADALHILQPLKESAAELSERGDVSEEPGIDEILETADRMGGFAGAALRAQFARLFVTREELETFLATSPPRDHIPPGIRRQVLGASSGFLIGGGIALLIGVAFVTFALVASTGRFRGAPPPLLFAAVGAVPATIGFALLVAGFVYRKNRLRILREGRLVEGTIEAVERSSIMVNNQPMHYVRIRYELDGSEHTAELRAMSAQGTKASRLKELGRPVRLLVDSDAPQRVLCPDLWLVSTSR